MTDFSVKNKVNKQKTELKLDGCTRAIALKENQILVFTESAQV